MASTSFPSLNLQKLTHKQPLPLCPGVVKNKGSHIAVNVCVKKLVTKCKIQLSISDSSRPQKC